MQTILAFILVFGTIVFVHELGHFLFAKRAGMLVREFAIGFGPKLFAHKRGETLYSLRLLPFGGYVRVAGEDPETAELKTGKEVALRLNSRGCVTHVLMNPDQGEPGDVRGRVMEWDLEHRLYVLIADEQGEEIRYRVDRQAELVYDSHSVQIAPWDRQYGAKSVGARAMFIAAGPLFNVLLSIILFSVLTMIIGVPDHLEVRQVQENSPAAEAGLQPGDRFVEVNGEGVKRAQELISLIQEGEGDPVQVTLERDGETFETSIEPVYNEETKTYQIGVIQSEELKDATLLTAVQKSFVDIYDYTRLIFDSFAMLVTGQVGFSDLAGPVGIADMTGEVAKTGVLSLINWTSFLSLYLGIFNILPIPALDGSRLMFVALEAVRGRPIDPKKEGMVHLIGLALFMMLMVAVTYQDIMRLFS